MLNQSDKYIQFSLTDFSELERVICNDKNLEDSDKRPTTQKVSAHPKVNDYVLVKFQGKTKNSFYYYIGTILRMCKDEFLIRFIKKSGKQFVWPDQEDISFVDKDDVVAVLEQPDINNRQQYDFSLDMKYQSCLA